MECTAHTYVFSIDNLNKCMKLPRSLWSFSSTELSFKGIDEICAQQVFRSDPSLKIFYFKITKRILIIFYLSILLH
jgi:hypothetical protein